MHQIKIFKGVENDIATLESEVNAWLKSNDVAVHQMSGNIAPQTPGRDTAPSSHRFSPSDIMIAIWYETKA